MVVVTCPKCGDSVPESLGGCMRCGTRLPKRKGTRARVRVVMRTLALLSLVGAAALANFVVPNMHVSDRQTTMILIVLVVVPGMALGAMRLMPTDDD